MQQFMATVLWSEFFIMCIAVAFWVFGTELGLTQIQARSVDLEAIEQRYNSTAQGYETSPFNAAFIFGDFGRAITEFMTSIFHGNLGVMIAKFGFAASFTLGIIVLDGLAAVCTLIYLVSGRG